MNDFKHTLMSDFKHNDNQANAGAARVDRRNEGGGSDVQLGERTEPNQWRRTRDSEMESERRQTNG